MRALKLILFGVVGVLGLGRGFELLFISRAIAPAAIPLVVGVACIALFVRTWKQKAPA